jgi:calcium-dependent protein kinase
VKLVDFGVADRIKKNDMTIRDAVGTAYYIAPEVLLGECDCKSDMWSLGVILYMMITGKPPFEG